MAEPPSQRLQHHHHHGQQNPKFGPDFGSRCASACDVLDSPFQDLANSIGSPDNSGDKEEIVIPGDNSDGHDDDVGTAGAGDTEAKAGYDYRCFVDSDPGQELEDPEEYSDSDSDSRCSSTSSIVTHAASESTTKSDMEAESLQTEWTDDKHKSYLTFMETNFVNKLYHREYCAVDVCGQAPCQHHNSGSLIPEFKSLQNGDWQWRSNPKCLIPACRPLALLRNPWINHFRHVSTNRATNAHAFPVMGENEEVNSPISTASPGMHQQSASTSKQDASSTKHGSDTERQEFEAVSHETAHFTNSSSDRKRSPLQDCDEQRSSARQKL